MGATGAAEHGPDRGEGEVEDQLVEKGGLEGPQTSRSQPVDVRGAVASPQGSFVGPPNSSWLK